MTSDPWQYVDQGTVEKVKDTLLIEEQVPFDGNVETLSYRIKAINPFLLEFTKGKVPVASAGGVAYCLQYCPKDIIVSVIHHLEVCH